jgi:hypothetical protein
MVVLGDTNLKVSYESFAFHMNVGDTVDFVVNNAGFYGGDTTPLAVEISSGESLHYWRFEQDGRFLVDSAGDADLTGSAQPALLPESGRGGTFPGYLTAPNGGANAAAADFEANALTTTVDPLVGDFTVEAFVHLDTLVDQFGKVIVGTTTDLRYAATSGWSLETRVDGYGDTEPGELVLVLSNGAAFEVVGSGLILTTGVDYYVAAAFDLDGGFVTYYVQDLTNGGALESSAVVHTIGNLNPVGALAIGDDGTGFPYFNLDGLIDEVRISAGVLSDDQLLINNATTAAYDYTAVNFYGKSYLLTQSAGFEFSPTTDLIVSALGFFDYLGDGLGEAHEVGIFDDTGLLLTSTDVPAGSDAPLAKGFRYSPIAPLALEAGKDYTVAAFLATQADVIGYLDVEDLVLPPEISVDAVPARYVTPSGGGLAFPTDTALLTSEFFLGPNFQFAPSVPSGPPDTEAPVLSLPADFSVEATSADGAAVTFAATAIDNVDGAVVPVCDPPSGSLFPLGTTEDECTATDAAGNTASGSFNVSVVDTTPPALTVPASIATEATGCDGAVVEFSASASDAVDGTVVAVCAPSSGATYPVGSTTVTCTAADAAGNGADASFLVTVNDTTPPVLTVPDDLSVVATGSAGAVVEYNATAVDLVDGDVIPVCAPASGSTFAVGETAVSCTATDTAGNSTSASFKVTVEPAPWLGPSLSVLPEYDFAVATGTTATLEVELFNASSATHTATLTVVNPHTDLGVSLTSQPSITLDPGQAGVVPLAIDAGSTPVATYSQILLEVSVDDGSLLATNITLYVTEAGAADQPDLALRAEDLAFASGDPGDPVTLKATVANRGSLPGTDVPVRFYEFGNLLGEVSLPAIPADGTAVASLPVALSDGGDHLIEVVVDPAGVIAELDETNNAASFVVSLNTPPAQQGGIRVTGGLPTTVYTDALFRLSGRAVYELNVGGVTNTDYVVKGGLVTLAIREIGGGREWLYGGIHTNVNGDFTKPLIAPDDPGTYQVLVTVTDQTFISPALTLIVQVSERPATPPPPPAVPVGLGGVIGGGSWSPGGLWKPPGGVLPADYPPFDVQHDLSVFSEDIRFSKNNPAAREEITLFAEIHYWAPRAELVAEDVPVTFSVTKPGQAPIEVGATVIDSISVGGPDYGSRYVYASWEGADDGIYLVEVDVASGSVPTTDEATLLNNAATRAIIVGELGAFAQGAISGQVTNPWGVVGDVPMSVVDQDDQLYGNALTDVTGFYLVSNLSVGDRIVEIEAPLGYQADAEAKLAEVVDRAVTQVDFFLTADTNPPVLDLPVDVGAEATGPMGAVVAYVVSATDAEDGEIVPSCAPASGSTFALGTTAVECSATDAAGNTASGSFPVNVVDTTAPVLTVPADISVEATGPLGAVVTYQASATDTVDGTLTPSCTPPSGSTFPLGATRVICTATDAAGNSADARFNLTVVDSTAPVVTVPEDLTVTTSDPAGASVNYSGVSATDLVDGNLTPTCAPPGAFFATGATIVTCSATDSHGNSGFADFSVTVEYVPVLDQQPPLVTSVAADPQGAPRDTAVELTALADDTTTGDSLILSAEYNVNDGTTWGPMAAVDGALDSPTEQVAATLTFPQAGSYQVCVRATDTALNTSTKSCTAVTVSDGQSCDFTDQPIIDITLYTGSDAGKKGTGLRLTSMGRIYDARGNSEYTVWRVRNGSTEDRTVALDAYKTSWVWHFTAPARTETFIASTIVGGPATHRLFHNGKQIDVKASSNAGYEAVCE